MKEIINYTIIVITLKLVDFYSVVNGLEKYVGDFRTRQV